MKAHLPPFRGTSSYTPLDTMAPGHTQLQGRLGNAVFILGSHDGKSWALLWRKREKMDGVRNPESLHTFHSTWEASVLASFLPQIVPICVAGGSQLSLHEAKNGMESGHLAPLGTLAECSDWQGRTSGGPECVC